MDPIVNQRTVLRSLLFRHTTVQVWTYVQSPIMPAGTLVLDEHPVFTPPQIVSQSVAVSLHTRPIPSTGEFLHEMSYPGYRRLWIPRSPDLWKITTHPSSAQMKQMMAFPASLSTEPVLIPAYGLWLGDAVIATGPLPDSTWLQYGDSLHIAFRLSFDH